MDSSVCSDLKDETERGKNFQENITSKYNHLFQFFLKIKPHIQHKLSLFPPNLKRIHTATAENGWQLLGRTQQQQGVGLAMRVFWDEGGNVFEDAGAVWGVGTAQ